MLYGSLARAVHRDVIDVRHELVEIVIRKRIEYELADSAANLLCRFEIAGVPSRERCLRSLDLIESRRTIASLTSVLPTPVSVPVTK